MNKREQEFFHSWYLLIVTFLSLLFLFINHKYILNLSLFIFCLYLYFKNGLELSSFIRIVRYAFAFSLSIFVLNILYQRGGNSLVKAGETSTHLFLIALLSMSSTAAIDFSKVVLYLIVHMGLRLFWGYPMLLAINSLALLKEEFERIKINARFRNLPLKDKVFIFFPLLVFAIRHSQRGALSLVTRGLSHQKSFYFSYELSFRDKTILLVFCSLYSLIVLFAFFV